MFPEDDQPENLEDVTEGMLGESEQSSDSNNHVYINDNIPRFITNPDGSQQQISPEVLEMMLME